MWVARDWKWRNSLGGCWSPGGWGRKGGSLGGVARWGGPGLFVLVQPDFWVVLGVYVCLFESIVPRDIINLGVDKLRFMKS